MIEWLNRWWTAKRPEDHDMVRRRAHAAQQLLDSETFQEAQQQVFDNLLRDLLYADEDEEILRIHRKLTALSDTVTMCRHWATRLDDVRRAA